MQLKNGLGDQIRQIQLPIWPLVFRCDNVCSIFYMDLMVLVLLALLLFALVLSGRLLLSLLVALLSLVTLKNA